MKCQVCDTQIRLMTQTGTGACSQRHADELQSNGNGSELTASGLALSIETMKTNTRLQQLARLGLATDGSILTVRTGVSEPDGETLW